jgi:3-phosphoshikimate 1-carboxyvinyltransferase
MLNKREVQPRSKLDGEVTVPGSKSYAARAMVIGALASGITVLKNHLHAEDTDYMLRGLEAFGVGFLETPSGLLIRGIAGETATPMNPVFLGGAGTAVRFLTTVAGISGGQVVIDGNDRMRKRPVQDLLDALEPLGIVARSINGNGCPPVVIEEGEFVGGRTTLRGGKSSQFVSSILLAGPYSRGGVEVEVTEDLVSRSYVDLTMEIMKDFGAEVTHENYRCFRVRPSVYCGRQYVVEGDLSSASYFFAAAAITGGRIRVQGINPRSKQGDRGFLDVLEAMGCRVNRGDSWVEVFGGPLRAVDIDMKAMPDSAQTLAVVAAFARGTTCLSGIGHLRLKESDRLTSLERELGKLGIHATTADDRLIVHGGDPQGGEIETYKDHRMAMAFAVAGLRVPGVVIRDPECVSKSFPDFWTVLEELR